MMEISETGSCLPTASERADDNFDGVPLWDWRYAADGVTFDATAEGRDEAGAAQPAKVQAKAQPAGVVSEDVGFFFRTPSTGLVVILDADEATATVLDGAVDVDDAMLGQLRTRAEAASAGSFAQAVSRGSQGLLELIFAKEDVPRSGKRLVGGETFHEVGSCLHEC